MWKSRHSELHVITSMCAGRYLVQREDEATVEVCDVALVERVAVQPWLIRVELTEKCKTEESEDPDEEEAVEEDVRQRTTCKSSSTQNTGDHSKY